jgi:hypothetical protein
MRLTSALMGGAAALAAAFALLVMPAALAEPLAHERAFADAELADAMVSSVTGGAQGIPKMDQITAAAIAADVAAGEFASAFARVRGYVISKGVAATLGNTASGFMAAVSAGEALGVRAQEHFGRGRLNALYTNLSQDANAAGWPASYREALRDDFFGDRFNAAILPVAHWLRRRSGQTGSDQYFAEMAYGMMIARRDFEQGCARYALSGPDCTPERLADEEAWHLERIARTHAAEHAADLRLLEVARLVREEAEANRARERAERALLEAEAQEAALAREAELAAERAAEEAEAATARTEAAREALAALREHHALPPPAALPPSAISADIVDTETSENRTLYRVRLTNTASEPIFGVAVDARMRTPAADSGVAIASGGELRTLAPGESVEVSFTGDGALDAVRLYVTGAGQLLGSFDYPMLHESAAPDEEAAGDEWITVPAVYRGTVTTRSSASMDEQLFPDLQNISTQQICEIELHIDLNGGATFHHAECDTNYYQVTQFRPDQNFDRYYLIFIERTGHRGAYTRDFKVNVVQGRFRATDLINESMPTRTPESYVQFNNSRIDWHVEGTTTSRQQDWEGWKSWNSHLIHSMSLQRYNN